MTKRYTQKDLVVLHIASQKGEWVRAYGFKGKFIKNEHIGSEGDRRAIELFEKGKNVAERIVDGALYRIERGEEGRYRTYRLLQEVPKPPPLKVEVVVKDGLPIALY